jgi:hypothetical protein
MRILPGVGWIGSQLLGLASFWDLLWCLGLPANRRVLLNPLPRQSMCTTSAKCKAVITAVITVKSGMEPHMINEHEDGFRSAFRLIFVALLSTNHKCTHPC